MANSTTISFNKQDKNFIWIFDHKDMAIKDILEIAEYDIVMDEETNQTSQIVVSKETTAVANDIIVFKRNNLIIYWGIIKQINNTNNENEYSYTCQYITNIFDRNILLERRISSNTIPEGYYRLISVLNSNGNVAVRDSSTSNNALVQLWSINNLKNGVWKIIPTSGHYKIQNVNSKKYLDVVNGAYNTPGNALCQTASGCLFDFVLDSDGYYNIRFTGRTYNNKPLMIGIDTEEPIAEGSKLQNWFDDGDENHITSRQFYLEKTTEPIIWETGIEDFLKEEIENNFTRSDDSFINKTYIDVIIDSHTRKDVNVANVDDNGIYNLHTYLSNCSQNYNMFYEFKIDTTGQTPKINMYIKIKTINQELIDVNAMSLSNYDEVFETDIVSKVIVATSTKIYELYLKTNRETTTDKNDPDRADGVIETTYTENYDEANQVALDIIRSNSYNHNISFSLKDKYYPIGTPVKIKTKKSLIYDTYISAVSISNNSFYNYQCGNIRVTLLEKLLKERK